MDLNIGCIQLSLQLLGGVQLSLQRLDLNSLIR